MKTAKQFTDKEAPAGVRRTDMSTREGFCSFPLQRLIGIARQSGIAEPSNCTLTFQLLVASRAVRHSVQRIVKPLGLSEARFLALVTLYVLDPEPSCPADLAYHAEITRSAMTDTLDQMADMGWIQRKRLISDRRGLHVYLTAEGRKIASIAIRRFLQVTGDLPRSLKPNQHKVFALVCRQLQQHAEASAL